ncbi:MgtC/SapB family protein [Silvibacterium dinghuense]|uniref:Protein MgtC n=1 Tax=Silvibacterium dinghuense TaxID=1560006 RepID=A0A4Q1SJP7_9BACT|nr:MgtC/SapB family protein [Silvibacterium dinghuense]RXS97663.1 MgtC/SapB family protein [Silvibacterium dinghuense]GGH00934.1 methyltransferase [Silvibacterium dinghuense]
MSAIHQVLAVISAAHPWWTDSTPLWKQQTFPRLLLALALGVCVGAERQWRQRAAGLRTNTLVCLGAAAFVDLGLTVAPNTTQVIAYVVSGVGFLGAGAIMKDGANVRGLNTAATLWCSAAVGACVGAGELLDGIFVAILLIGINSALRPLSRYIDQRSLAATKPYALFRLRILCEAGHAKDAESHLTRAIAERSLLLRELRTEDEEASDTSVLQAVLESQSRSDEHLQEVAAELRACPWVESVDVSGTDPDAE